MLLALPYFFFQMSKRPSGLSSKLSKRSKPNPETIDPEETLVLEVSSSLNEMDELQDMHDSALATLESEPDIALLRGCIHECDKMVRVRHSTLDVPADELAVLQQSIDALPVLPQRFHLIYANSLFYAGLLDVGDVNEGSSGNLRASFMDAAIERAEIGLEIKEKESYPDLLHSVARSYIHKCALMDDWEMPIEHIKSYIKKLQHHTKALSKESAEDEATKEGLVATLLELAQCCFLIGDKLADITVGKEWISYMESLWQFVLTVDAKCSEAQIGLGNCSLALADMLLDGEDDDSENVDCHGATKSEEKDVDSDKQTEETEAAAKEALLAGIPI
jgi:Nuclear pore complex subunit Nro1